MNLAAVVATVVLHVTTRPAARVPVRAEVTCEGVAAGEVEGWSGDDLRLPVPCGEAAVRVSAEEFVPRTVRVAASTGRVGVVLERYAQLVLGAGPPGTPPPALWWRPAGGRARRLEPDGSRRVRLVAEEGCLGVLAGDREPVLLPLEPGPGEELAAPPASRAPGTYLRGAVVDGEGHAVSARVRVRPDGERPLASDACRALGEELGLLATFTGNDGDFRLGPLPGGVWTVEVSAEGHATRTVTVRGRPGGGEVDLGEIRLPGIASLEIALDASGCPEPPPYRVRVDREVGGWADQRARWHREASVEADGERPVVLEGLQPGSYRVRVDRPRGRLSAVEFVELTPGSTQRVVVHLQPFSVTGVVRRDGSPVAGARVRFLLEGASVEREADEDGRYRVSLWTPGDYAVLASAPDDPTPYPTHLDLTDAGPGDERTLDIDLPSRQVAGVVVERDTGRPVAGATVALSETGTATGVRRSQAVRTGEDGSFRFTNLMEGPPVSVTASAEGFLPQTVTVDPESPEARQLVLELRRGEAVRGRVVEPPGTPVEGAQVMCCPLGAHGGFGSVTTSGVDGRFTLDARAGELLWAVARGLAFGWARAVERGETVILLQPQQGVTVLELRTEAGDPVAGVQPLFSAPDGTPIPPRLVEIAAFLAGESPLTGSDGTLTLWGFPPGTYQVWLPGPGGLEPLGAVPVPSTSPVVLSVPASSRSGGG